jgi:CheY-like chemotaxis protein
MRRLGPLKVKYVRPTERYAAMAMQPKPGPEFESVRDGTGLTVLLADDEAAIRTFAGAVLRSCGYEVLEAGDGAEALEVSDRYKGPIHLLVTDWRMPRLDGGELIRSLRTRRPETAILIMSGYLDTAQAPDSPVLSKPFTPGVLVRKCQDVLDRGVGPGADGKQRDPK